MEQEEEKNQIGATEARLLQAMSVPDAESNEDIAAIEYSAYAGETLPADVEKAKMYDIVEQNDTGDLYIEMTLTAPTCPIAGVLPQQVADAAAQTQGVGKVEVKLVWEPAWTPDKMTDEAKEMLELL